MYECRNCGGGLRYDIPSQQLVCDYCETSYLVSDISKEKDGEQDKYDVTIFHCPQCGGQIYSMDTTAAGFCSYCGASTILQSRLEKENKVQYIIPFQKTKEDCKKAYMRIAKRAIFAPRELKDRKYIEGFRGIYMPYWIYDVSQEGNIHFPGEQSYRKGNYIITDHYDLRMDVEMKYSGLHYDGAASFADDISRRVAPFEIEEKKEFLPGYLCGFYADMSDVDREVYMKNVTDFVMENTCDCIYHILGHLDYSVDSEKIKESLPTGVESIQSAMFPIWFMAYQKKNRVVYTMVNGQTGKIFADLPVDITKYFLGTAVLSIPIIVVLNMFFTIIPSVLLVVTSYLALFVSFLHKSEMEKIAIQEGDSDDKGKIYKEDKKIEGRFKKQEKMQEVRGKDLDIDSEDFLRLDEQPYEISAEQIEVLSKKNKSISKRMKGSGGLAEKILARVFVGAYFVLIICTVFQIPLFPIIHDNSAIIGIVLTFFTVFPTVSYGKNACENARSVKAKKQKNGGLFPIAAVAIAMVIEIINPVEDYWYYFGSVAAMLSIGACLVDLIFGYNLLVTRRVTQFAYKGGDNHA